MKDNLLASKQASRLQNCTFVKTILMTLVVLYHSCIFWTNAWFMKGNVAIQAKGLAVFSRWLNFFHISCFTLVSGYLFCYLRYETNKYQEFLPYIINKGKRLLIPYIFAATVWVIPISLFLNQIEINEVIKNYILGISPSQLWFLLMLFGVFIIAWPISNVFWNYEGRGLLLVIFIYFLGRKLSGIIPNYYYIFTSFQYLIYFYVGFEMRKKWDTLKIPVYVWVIMNVFLFALYNVIDLPKYIFDIVEFIIPITGAVAAFELLQEIATHLRWEQSLFWRIISKNSMPIYLFHQQIIYFVIIYLNGKINPYLNAFLNFITAFCISLLMSNLLMHWKITRFLIGEK